MSAHADVPLDKINVIRDLPHCSAIRTTTFGPNFAFVVERKPADLDMVLLAGLRDTNEVVRGRATQACAGRGDPGLVPALSERIRPPEESTDVVVSAIRA